MTTKKSATPVADKLTAMNVSVIKINDKVTQLEVDLETRRDMLAQYRKAITQLEAEANAILGSIQTCKELLAGEK